MIESNSAPTALLPAAVSFVNQELKRIPTKTKTRLKRLGVFEDLTQDLHLTAYQEFKLNSEDDKVKRAMHAAGERFRYHEIVRRAKFEVPEELAGEKYHQYVYGKDEDQDLAN